MITTVIVMADPDRVLQRVFVAEQQDILQDRASYSVRHERGETSIEVVAKDATALRAMLNGVCKTIIIHEKAGRIADDGAERGDEATGAD